MPDERTAAERTAARSLGAALRGYRVARGLSMRALAKQVGLATHGTLVDYEHGRRIPPEDLIIACEKALDLDGGQLRQLRAAALSERAGTQAAALLAPEPPSPNGYGAPARRWVRRRYLVLSLAVLVAVVGAVAAVVLRHSGGQPRLGGQLRSGRQLRFGFETPTDRWTILWGDEADGAVTSELHYEGAHAYAVTITGSSRVDGYISFGTTHGVESLRSGMKVTMHLWTSYPQNGVRFFVYDANSKAFWAPETPTPGTEMPLSGGPSWSTVTWTVPEVPEVHGIGVQPYTDSAERRTIAVDAVSW